MPITITGATLTSDTTDSGSSSTDFITSDRTLVFGGSITSKTGSGTGTLGVWISGGSFGTGNGGKGTLIGSTSISGTGAWSFDFTGTSIAEGSYTVHITNGTGGGASDLSSHSLVVDITNPTTPTDSNAAANSIAENAANGSTVGLTAASTDTNGKTFSITSDSSGGGFAVNASTGVVTVADGTKLNYEAATSHSITILATDTAGNTSSQTFTIALTDVNEFSVGAVSDSNATTNAVAENAANGTTVGVTASASDADATTNAITYSLDSSAGGAFQINSSTGVVTVANGTLINREANSSLSITVRATSADGSFSTQNFTINLNDVNEFSVGAVGDSNATTNAVAENAANGTTVGLTASASDADATTNAITYSLDSSAGGAFQINSSTGVVTVANGTLLNREANSSLGITVRATSADGSFSTQSFTIAVNDVNEFSVGAVSDGNATTNAVAENAANGTAVGITASASDADATTNAITYSLDGNAGGAFQINSSTGVVTVADGTLINREATSSLGIIVRATSADGSFSTQSFTIAVNDVNEFSVGAVSDGNAAANSVAENAANGTAVGITASASDADATTNAITYSLDSSAGGAFQINSSTGVVTVADGTLINREANSSLGITVRATSADNSFSTQSFTIAVNDVNEFSVGAVSDGNAAANAVAENAANGTTVGITASASDADATSNAITYSLDSSAGGAFQINSSTGVVTVADGTLINREANSSLGITVRATSADGSFSTQSFTINLNDVNEFSVGAVSDGNAAGNAVAENAATGTAVGITASASDADATTNAITYSLDSSAGGAFQINSSTGVVTVADGTLINREANSSLGISVRATSADGSFSTQSFTIAVNDVNEFSVGAVSDGNATINAVAENAANGSAVGITASASDADATTNAITYSLDSSAGGAFQINSSTGVVSVADGTLLNRESDSSLGITVLATSADGSFSTQSFTINLNDVNEFSVGAVSDSNATANAINENAANGTTVGLTASASDADATTNAITYSLDSSAGGAFQINSSTGVVTVADGSLIDRESDSSLGVTVRATSADGSFSTQTFTINVNDLNEFSVGAVSDSNATANAVAENAANGTTVGLTASASDADATTNAITYSLDSSAGGAFQINSSTGVVTVADGTLIDRESDSSLGITVRATSADGSFSTRNFTINVNDVNEFGVGAVADSSAAANTVDEGAASGTMVGITASASDADATTNAITYSLDSSAGGAFQINSSTGVVTVADGTLIDRESDSSLGITVRATSADGSFSTQSFTITVNDVNEFSVGALSDGNAAANAVAENAANGTTVGITASASDADATTNAITYSLDSSAGGAFQVNSSTGVVTVADGTLIDRESDNSLGIIVRATSADGSFSTQSFTIAVNDVNEFSVGPVSDGNAAANAVSENAASGTTVGVTANASDADATGNAIAYSLDDSAGGAFQINSSTGVVTVADGTLIDRESDSALGIIVRATSADGSFSTQNFTMAVNDVNEFSVGAVSDSSATANAVDEGAASGTTVGIAASASDADATTNAITYSLDSSAGGAFQVNSSTGVVTVADGTLIDRENDSSLGIIVRATSSDGSFSTQSFTINVNDVNEFSVGAVNDGNAVANAVAENAANGTTVGITASASDGDATSNTIVYSLDSSAGGIFQINSSTGVVRVADGTLIDRESDSSLGITVRATSADGSFSTQSFTIAVNDVNEFGVGAVSDGNAQADAVDEGAATGTVVGISAGASDADATFNTVSYSLDDNAGGAFQIDASTGAVTVADGSLIDRESSNSLGIVVRATSADGSFSTQSFTISVNDIDEFDVGAVSDADASSDAIDEGAANGTAVGITASASDADATGNAITYSLDDDAGGAFQIDGSSGVVTVADGSLIDRESDGSLAVIVRATSADGSFSTESFTIAVDDVNEFSVGAVSDSDPTANAVDEGAANGAAVGITAGASDADATGSAVTYSLDSSAGGAFAIDASTGVVTIADGSLIDRETDASLGIVVRATSADGSFSTRSFTIAVNDVNEFAVSALSDGNTTANTVDENAASGTAVGVTASASDADATGSAVSYSLDDNAGGAFQIDSASGVVTIADGSLVDRESNASLDIAVRATSADGSWTTETFTIAVNDVDEFDTGVVSDSDAVANAVDEGASTGTIVGITAGASDGDATNNAVTYSLDDSAGGAFHVDGSTGVVTVADGTLIDRESDTSLDIVIRATSSDGSFSTATFSVAINDVDEAGIGAMSDVDASPNGVAENAAAGTGVGITALASDADATSGVVYTLDDDAGGAFQIDDATGVVTVADGSRIDRESDAALEVTIRATSTDSSFSTHTFTIAVGDVDEFDIGAVGDSNPTANLVNEGAADGTVVGITAAATDPDATATVSYSLDDDAGGAFAVDETTGNVTVADGSLIDREEDGTLDVTVRATSTDGSFSTETFTIGVNDVDEFNVGAVSDIDVTGAANAVDEGAATGTRVGITAVASDSDATNNTVNYSLDNDAGGAFAIDGSTGVVTVADGSVIDRETSTSLGIVVRATSADGSFSTESFSIAVGDVNEFGVGPLADGDATANEVGESAVAGTTVGIAAGASDADATAIVTYSLDDDAGGAFAIDGATGVIIVADGSLIDRESSASLDLTVRATSSDGSLSTEIFTVGIDDVDEFNVGAIADANLVVNAVSEGAATGTVVGIWAEASDGDATNNAITWSLDNDAGGAFQIDSSTGVVTVLDGSLIDRESASSLLITARATSADGSFSTKKFSVGIRDVNDNAPQFTSASSVHVAENTTLAYTASAVDADIAAAYNTVRYSLSSGGDNKWFTIDAATGVVSFKQAPDFETPSDADHDNTFHVTVHAANRGTDTTQDVAITVDNVAGIVAMGSHLTGTVEEDQLTGTSGDDALSGGKGADVLIGGFGNDSLVGGLDGDTMAGGAGNDSYVVDSKDDTVVELADEGTDTVWSSVTYTLGANVENLMLSGAAVQGTGNELDNTMAAGDGKQILLGGDGDDALLGGAGVDSLRGGAGDDVMTGGLGADTLTGGAGHDVFVYTAANESTGTSYDSITDRNLNADKIQTPFAVTGVDAPVAIGDLSAATFNTDLSAALTGKLGSHHAVGFTASGGTLAGESFLIIDANGVAGYQAGADLVIHLQTGFNLATIDTGDFI